jgi:DNA-binding Lrp family transcriptional regulator
MKEEALAKAIADNGAKFVTETRKNDFIQWVNEMWKQVAKAFGIQDLSAKQIKALTLEEFAKMAAADVFAKEKQKFPENVLNIAKETGLSPQEVQNTYKKYDGTKNIEEITIDDYNNARAVGNEQKLENSKKAFEALLKADSDSPTAKKKADKLKEEVSKETLKGASDIMENIDEIRKQLLDAGVIKSINCKWGK